MSDGSPLEVFMRLVGFILTLSPHAEPEEKTHYVDIRGTSGDGTYFTKTLKVEVINYPFPSLSKT